MGLAVSSKAFGSTDGRLRGLALASSIAGLTAATGGVSIPLFITPVPLTLQVFFVYLAGALGGMRYGGLSMLIYLFLGAAGLPVFSGFRSGLPHLLGPTGGYLFAFPLASALCGFVSGRRASSSRKEWSRIILGMIAAIAAVYVVGVLWLSLYMRITLFQGVLLGALPFIPVDLLKMAVAAPIAVKLRREVLSLPTAAALR